MKSPLKSGWGNHENTTPYNITVTITNHIGVKMSADENYLDRFDDYILSGRRMPDEFPYWEDIMEDREAYEAELEEMARKYVPEPEGAPF